MLGRIHQLNVAPEGGTPKLPVPEVEVRADGVVGDLQRDRRHHGGPERAACLYSLDVIHRLQAEGHPIAPGTIGENVTIAGLPWELVLPGARFLFEGGVELEVTSFAAPCSNIRGSFTGGDILRVRHEKHPGWSRAYTRVLREGRLRVGEPVRLQPTGAP